MTTIKLHDGDMGDEEMLVRCNLTRASAPVDVNYQAEPGSDWESTRYQCADAGHALGGLVRIGEILAAQAIEVPVEEFECEWTEV
jgi:hypothetical protein